MRGWRELASVVSWRWHRVRQALPHATVWYAHRRAFLGLHRLPPGNMASVTPVDASDRARLRRRADRWGPIFRATFLREFCVVVTDLGVGRRLLAAHADDLRPITFDIRRVVPEGFMRQMHGDVHRRYRKGLARAVVMGDLQRLTPVLEQIVEDGLLAHAEGEAVGGAPMRYADRCLAITSELLHVVFCSGPPETPDAADLKVLQASLASDGQIWHVDDEQVARARALMHALRERARALALNPTAGPVILSRLAAASMLDDVMMANISYMLHTGSYDLHIFFVWLTRFAAADASTWRALVSEANQPVAADDPRDVSTRYPQAHSLVLEVLRHTQSDRLMRRVLRDIHFDGVLIPKGSLLRIGLWEAHHDPEHFDQPMQFRADRFITQRPDPATFSPFGVGAHLCPFATASVELGTLFVATLARCVHVKLVNEGPGVIGIHHWVPPADFDVQLERRA